MLHEHVIESMTRGHLPATQAGREEFLRELRALRPPDAVLEHPAQLRPYECDGLSAYRQLPLAVVLPRSVEEVRKVVRLCHRHTVPLVGRGAGTGLSGGALPHAEGIVLSLARLNRILEIDPARRIARVEPGVRNLAVSEAAAAHGLYFAPDPSSQIACTIGGDGNLHPLILYDANRPGELERAERFGGAILELCVAHGGTITAEHGVGMEKINQMCVQFGAAELTQFHAVKRAFDPHGILNPGKAIPTLRRCAEFGAMHVHGGALPFPGLERF